MVGEIRDDETVELAIRAALTGHLVFSTIHTNDAASGFARLLNWEIEPFLIASTVKEYSLKDWLEEFVKTARLNMRSQIENQHYLSIEKICKNIYR